MAGHFLAPSGHDHGGPHACHFCSTRDTSTAAIHPATGPRVLYRVVGHFEGVESYPSVSIAKREESLMCGMYPMLKQCLPVEQGMQVD